MNIVWKHIILSATSFAIILAITACSNSQSIDYPTDNAITSSDTINQCTDKGKNIAVQSNSSFIYKNYIPLDDTEYPYAGLPRIVIETENFQKIKDRETEIPAKLQIWGKNAPESDIIELTIRGRGYSSWLGMPKKSYKIELNKKHSFNNFPADRDWDLIANYADKTLLRNHISYRLSNWLGAAYSPRTAFYELFINKEYSGIYMLSEHIKVSKNRVNISEDGTGFLLEREMPPEDNKINITTASGTNYRIRFPKNDNLKNLDSLVKFLNNWEYFKNSEAYQTDSPEKFLDIDAYVKFYWVQEFSKNNDAAYNRSIFSTWQVGGQLKYGPVWDFDVAYGNKSTSELQNHQNWYIREKDWNKRIIRNKIIQHRIKDFWERHSYIFESLCDSIDVYSKQLSKATENEYKRWDITNQPQVSNQTEFRSYNEAIENLKNWISKRITWIKNNYKNN